MMMRRHYVTGAVVVIATAMALVLFWRRADPRPATIDMAVPAILTSGRVVSRYGVTMPYRLFTPRRYNVFQPYPLIVWLHGSDGTGTDNELQIAGDQTPGTHVWIGAGMQARHPAFVVAPQSASNWDLLAGASDPHLSVAAVPT